MQPGPKIALQRSLRRPGTRPPWCRSSASSATGLSSPARMPSNTSRNARVRRALSSRQSVYKADKSAHLAPETSEG